MTFHVHDATFEDLTMVGSWLCEEDRRELAVTRDPDDYVKLAKDALLSPIKKVVVDELSPIFAFGATPVFRKKLALVWGFKTERGWSAALTVTKYIKRIMIPELRAMGIRRAVCVVHPENTRSQKWLALLGFTPRATLDGIGNRPLLLFQRDEPDAPPSLH
jgi:hypothetical protein